jgi:hypothetical protein
MSDPHDFIISARQLIAQHEMQIAIRVKKH